jgi:predicted Holliday junction resolvase-like endonuclease
MDGLWLLIGLVVGFIAAQLLLRGRGGGGAVRRDETALRDEIAQRYEAEMEAERVQIARAYEARIQELEDNHRQAVVHARRHSTQRSRAVLKGKMAEQMAPLLPGFPYWPADARFLGDPVDYLVFDGYSACKDNHASGDDLDVVILDIKQGKSVLTREQRQIARAIEEGRVRFEVVRVFADGRVRSRVWRPHHGPDVLDGGSSG